MYRINMYLETSIRGIKRTDGWYGYLLEYIDGKGNLHTRYDFRYESDVTPNMLALIAFCAALNRMTADSEITVYTDNLYVKENYGKWLQTWKENGWKTARGEQIKNLKLWQQVAETTAWHVVRFAEENRHGYKNWMVREIERRKERRKDRDVF